MSERFVTRSDRIWHGRTFLMSMAALLAETMVAWTVLTAVALARHQDPGAPALLVFALVPGAVAGAVLTVALVLPVAAVARRAGTRWGHDQWWWVLLAAPVVALCLGCCGALLSGLSSGGVLSLAEFGWVSLVLTVLAVPAALLVRLVARALREGRRPPSGLRVVGAGAAVCVGVALLAGLADAAGLLG